MPETVINYYKQNAKKYDDYIRESKPELINVYQSLGSFLPKNTEKILDLGPGTGLELKSVFARFPNLYVDAIDISQDMVSILVDRYPEQDIRIVCDDFCRVRLNTEYYDSVLAINSFSTLTEENKFSMFKKIHGSLRKFGSFIYFNSFAKDFDEEYDYLDIYLDALENKGLLLDEAYNFYLPLTVDKEINMLEELGFRVDIIWSRNNQHFLHCMKR